MRLSLRNRFLLPTLILIIISLGASTAISYYLADEALTDSVRTQLKRISTSIVASLDSWIKDRKLDVSTRSREPLYLEALSAGPEAQKARREASGLLAQMQTAYGYYESIALADASGNLVASSNPKLVGKINVGDRGYFKEALSGKTTITTSLVRSKATNNPIMVIAAPVQNRQQVEGVLFAVVDVGAFSKRYIDDVKIGETGYAYVTQSDGMIIAHRDKSLILKTNINQWDWGKAILAQGSGFMSYKYQGSQKVVSIAPIKDMGWTVMAGATLEELTKASRHLGLINLIIAGVSIVLVAVIVFLVASGIVKALNRIIRGLTDGSEQVAGASGQLAGASQELAEGSSEQAAALEETASSMEEMSAMTNQNADNAGQADVLMKETTKVVSRADGSMTELTKSMDDISAASDETAKIVKTIDEIAFQTNLLALNAAVEAARAGEAGAGFAVVADEVRNLAIRAAEAARNTASLIQSTVEKVHEGGGLVQRTAEDFGDVSQSIGKVNELVGDIAAASSEQAQGIEQVNQAMSDMEKTTQRLAASAEESASASEEMSAQAKDMEDFVADLNRLVTGRTEEKAVASVSRSRRPNKTNREALPAPPAMPKASKGGAARHKMSFDDEDFKDF